MNGHSGRIVLGYDGSPPAGAALDWAEASVYTLESRGGPTFGSIAQEAATTIVMLLPNWRRRPSQDLEYVRW
jgi:hypothetical protein